MNNKKEQKQNQEENENLAFFNDDAIEESFVDFIDGNFEAIKIAACSRDSISIWVCK